MKSPDRNTSISTVRTALRRLVFGSFVSIVMPIVLLIGEATLSAFGLSSDPHGYAMVADILAATVLIPVALASWQLCQSMQRRGN